MANDLASGMLGLSGLSVLSFVAGRWVRSPRISLWFFGVLLTSLVFAWTFAGNLAWAALLPDPSVVFFSNLMPLLLSFAAGLISERGALSKRSRPIAIASFLSLAAAYTLTPYVRPLVFPVEPDTVTQWNDGVCLQTHPSTCAPAAAVTLLHLQGLSCSERQLVETCLTSSLGTEPLGLYRGLSLAVGTSGHRAKVAGADPYQWDRDGELPNIALVRLGANPQTGSSRWLLGPRSEGHAIVVLGRDLRGNWLIADPAFGKTSWTDEQFQSRFTGDAVFLAALSRTVQ
jgi:hypothetical protein